MRPLRVVFVANDGLSAGHVVRMLALARELGLRPVSTQRVLVTTSQAHALFAVDGGPAIVQLPSPASARRAGLDDASRRRLVRGAMDGVLASFAPDVVVVDTFPSGPHGELELGARAGESKNVLVRRATANADDPRLQEGLHRYHLGIVCDDPGPVTAALPMTTVRVPPITLFDDPGADRAAARAKLGLPAEGEIILVTAGGGGDDESVDQAGSIARALAGKTTVALAAGPLSTLSQLASPLQPWLSAFDGAFSAAGYNTAHELAKARIPTVFFARPRPFDDQAARAERFAARGLATTLTDVETALAWIRARTLDAGSGMIERGGAARAVDALLALAGA